MQMLLIKKARIIDPGRELDHMGDILVADGKIAEVADNIEQPGAHIIDAGGLVAAPGLVDMHVHLRDPGFTYKEDIISGGEAAAAGGVTSVAAMPNTDPVCDSIETIKYIKEKAKSAKINIYPVASITKGLAGEELTDFAELKKAGAIAFSDDGKPVLSARLMAKALKEATLHNMPILAHSEDLSLSEGGIMNEGVISEMLGVKGIPFTAENVGTARDLALAISLNARLHICHVSTKTAHELIRDAKLNGTRVTAETCPQYFSLNHELLMHRDADYRMNPPLRSQEDKRAIIRGIMDGTIDAIATDHAPHSVEDKKDFLSAPCGMIGLETSLSAGITNLVNSGYISLFKLLYMMSTVPARILGIPGGNLKKGSPADIVIFSAEEKYRVDVNKFHGKSKNSGFKDMELVGKVKYTIVSGKIVYKD